MAERILIVDDEEVISEIISIILVRAGTSARPRHRESGP